MTSSGTLTAPGGEVRVLGHTISLTGEAKIDVSGETGGTILVGGDYQGKNPDILNAEYNFVDPHVIIKADSLGQGNGGKVIFWSDIATYFYGKISAKGGPLGGDGGFAEVSGDYLDYQGLTNLLSPLGKAGTLLLDPTTVTIGPFGEPNVATNSGFTSFENTPCPGTTAYQIPNANNATIVTQGSTGIGYDLVENLLLCNVTINSSSGFTGSGIITINQSVAMAPESLSLTINAVSDIIVNAQVDNTATNGAQLTLNASGNLIINSTIYNASTGALNLTAGQDMWVYNDITNTTSVTNVTVGGNTNLVGGYYDIGANEASISGVGVNLTSTGPLTLIGGSSSSYPAFIASTAATTISAPSVSLTGVIGGGAAQIQNTTGNLSVTATSGLITLSDNANITLSGGSGTLTVSSISDDLILQNSASISNQGSGPTMITVGGTATLLAGQGDATIASGTGSLTLNVTTT